MKSSYLNYVKIKLTCFVLQEPHRFVWGTLAGLTMKHASIQEQGRDVVKNNYGGQRDAPHAVASLFNDASRRYKYNSFVENVTQKQYGIPI